MTAPDDIYWPDVLAAMTVEHVIDAAEDHGAAIAAPDMTAQFSDDIGFVFQQIRIAEERLVPIQAGISAAQEAGDDDAYDTARDAFSAAYSELVALEGRLMDLEDRRARADHRSNRAWYQWSVL